MALNELAPDGEWYFTGVDHETWFFDDPSRTDVTVAQIDTRAEQLATEYPLKQLRTERNKRLAETDWWVLPDRTATQPQLDYRQALRDITDTYTSLDTVVWPTKP